MKPADSSVDRTSWDAIYAAHYEALVQDGYNENEAAVYAANHADRNAVYPGWSE